MLKHSSPSDSADPPIATPPPAATTEPSTTLEATPSAPAQPAVLDVAIESPEAKPERHIATSSKTKPSSNKKGKKK